MKENINKKIVILILINIFYIFASSYMFITYNFLHKYISYGYIALLIVNTIFSVIHYKKGYYRKNITHIFILLLIILGIISTIFAVNVKCSLFGAEQRDEGLFMLIYYLSILYLSSYLNRDSKKVIINFVLLTGTVQALYAVFQVYKLPFVNIIYNDQPSLIKTPNGTILVKELWATGFLRNPNFFGTYMLICLCFSIGAFVDEKLNKKSIKYIIFIALFLYGLLISNATAAAVGLLFVILYLLIYMIKNKYYKKILIGLFVVVIVTSFAYFTNKTTLIKDIQKTGTESLEIAKGNINDQYGTKRIYIWKNTLKIVPKHLIHGAGIDNFYYAFNGSYLKSPLGQSSYDKAHNEYLQMLVCEGIFALITYLLMIIILVYWGIKNSFKNKEVIFILPVIGYLIQAFFTISIIEIAPLFYLALGFCVHNKFNS